MHRSSTERLAGGRGKLSKTSDADDDTPHKGVMKHRLQRSSTTSRASSDEGSVNRSITTEGGGLAQYAKIVSRAISKRTMSFKTFKATKAEKGVQTKWNPEHTSPVVSFLEELCQLTDFAFGEVWVRHPVKETSNHRSNRVHPSENTGSFTLRRTNSGTLRNESSITSAFRMFRDSSVLKTVGIKGTKHGSLMIGHHHPGVHLASDHEAKGERNGEGGAANGAEVANHRKMSDRAYHHPNGTSTLPAGALFTPEMRQQFALEEKEKKQAAGKTGSVESSIAPEDDAVLPFSKQNMAGTSSPHGLSPAPCRPAPPPQRGNSTPRLEAAAGSEKGGVREAIALPPDSLFGIQQAVPGAVIEEANADTDIQTADDAQRQRRSQQPGDEDCNSRASVRGSRQRPPCSPPIISEDHAVEGAEYEAGVDQLMASRTPHPNQQSQGQQHNSVHNSSSSIPRLQPLVHKENSLLGRLTGRVSNQNVHHGDVESGRPSKPRGGRRFSVNKFFGGSGGLRRTSVFGGGAGDGDQDHFPEDGHGHHDGHGHGHREPLLGLDMEWSGHYYCSPALLTEDSGSKVEIDKMVAIAKDTVYSKGDFAVPSLAWAKKDLNWHDLAALEDDDDLVADQRVATAKQVPFSVSVGIPILNRAGKTRAVVMLYRSDSTEPRRGKEEMENDHFLLALLHSAQNAMPAVLDVEATLTGFRQAAELVRLNKAELEGAVQEDGTIIVPSAHKKGAQNFLMAYFAKFAGAGAQAPQGHDVRYAAWAFTGTLLSMLIITSLDQYLLRDVEYKDGHLFALMASFGAVSTMLFAAPTSQLVQPRNVVGGHIISVSVAICLDYLTNDDYLGILPQFLATSLAPAISIAIMCVVGLIHPPAGAASVIYISGNDTVKNLSWLFLALPVLADIFVLIGMAIVINNMSRKRKYPLFW